MDKQISVLMPTRNSAHFIKDSLKSIEKEGSISEILVLDSSSTDGTTEIAAQHEKVKIIHCGEMNISEALNSALSYVETKYVARMDADDICHFNRFTRQLDFLKAGNYDLVGSDISYIGTNSWYLNYIKRRHFLTTNIEVMLFYKSPIVHPTWLMKTELLDTIRYRNQLAEDYDFLARAKMSGARFGFMNEEMLSYRLTSNQSSKQKRDRMLGASNDVSMSYISWYASCPKSNLDSSVKETFFCPYYYSIGKLINDYKDIRLKFSGLLNEHHLKEVFFRLLFRLSPVCLTTKHLSFIIREFGLAFSLDIVPLLIRNKS